jgi:serralysin
METVMAINVVGRVLNGTAGYDNFAANDLSDRYQMTVDRGVIDTINAGNGNDTLSYVNADRAVKVTMGSGREVGRAEADYGSYHYNPSTGQHSFQIHTERVTQFTNIENVTGSNYSDTITGNAGSNRLEGGPGRDTIDGGGGADTIVSGRDSDQIWGGQGADTFVFDHFLDSSMFNVLSSVTRPDGNYTTGAGVDVINDFLVGTDKIDLSGIDANSTISGNQAFQLIPQSIELVEEFTGQAGQLRLTETSVSPGPDRPGLFFTSVQGDIDGDGFADFTLQVVNPFSMDALSAADFIL